MLYHWRARCHQKTIWLPFKRNLNRELVKWPQKSRTLLIVGSSGGYTLSTEWLERYQDVHTFDIDPLAGFFFKRSHPQVRFHFHRQNMFYDGMSLTLQPINDLLKAWPGADILFSNVLGQVLIDRPLASRPLEKDWEFYLKQLSTKLENSNWASYHDRFSQTGNEKIDHLTGGEWTSGMRKESLRWSPSPEHQHEIELAYKIEFVSGIY